MRTIPQFVFRFGTVRSRITASLIALSLLLGFALWGFEWNVRVKAAPTPQVAAESGLLYILNNCNRCANSIFGFAVDETSGDLTPLTGFPIPTGGNGKSNSLSSELLTIDRQNLRLFAINDESNTVSAFRIEPSGALTSMFNPIDLPLITPPTTNARWSTIAVRPSGSDSLLVVGDINGGTVIPTGGRLASFKITGTTATLVSLQNTGDANPLSTAFSKDGRFVYTGGGQNTTIAGFQVIEATGELTPLNNGVAFPSSKDNPSAYATDVSGRLFVVSRPFAELLVFTTNANTGNLSSTPVNTPTPSGVGHAVSSVLHPNGFFMVSGLLTDLVSVHKVNGVGSPTTLTPVGTFKSGGTSVRVVLNQAGNFLFATNRDRHNKTIFQVLPTGVLVRKPLEADNTLCPQAPTACALGNLSGMAYLPPRTTTTTIDPPVITCGQESIVVVKVSSAAGTPVGDVFLTVDGIAPPLKRPLIGDTATFPITLGPGNHTFDATFPAQGGLPGSSSVTVTQVVVSVSPTKTTITAPGITFGQNGSVTVKVSSTSPPFLTPVGEVKLSVGGVEMSPQTLDGSGSTTFSPIIESTVGDHSLVATFSAQGCFGESDDSKVLKVKVAPTRTDISAPAIISGLDATVTVAVKAGFKTPSGIVKLTVDGVAMEDQTLSVAGPGSFTISVTFPPIKALTVGDHSLVANFPAQGGFAASSATLTLTVKKAKPTITKISAPSVTLRIPSIGQIAPVTVNVRSSSFPFTVPLGKVSLKVDNGTAMTLTLSHGTATFNLVVPAAGFHSLKATFLGQPGVFSPSSASGKLIVKGAGPRETTTTINAPPITQRIPSFGQIARVIVNLSSIAGTPSGNVSLTVDGGTAMMQPLSGGTVTFNLVVPKVGNHSLVARFNGSAGFLPSHAIGTLVVNKPTVKP